MSAGVPARPSGTIEPTRSTPGKSPRLRPARAIGVSTRLGAIVFAVIPCRANSTASAFVSAITPPFDAA